MSTKSVATWIARLSTMVLPMGADKIAAARERCMLAEIKELRAALTETEPPAGAVDPSPGATEADKEACAGPTGDAFTELAKRMDNCEVLLWALRAGLLGMARVHGDAMERHVQNEFNSVLAKADAVQRQQQTNNERKD